MKGKLSYGNILQHMKRPGMGEGFHTSILGIANCGVRAGVKPETIFANIRENIPPGKRPVSDKEITEAINKALSNYGKGVFTAKPQSKPIVNDGKAALRSIIRLGKYSDDADLWEASPIRLYDEPQRDAALFLSTLYEPDDLVWIGERYENGILGNTIRPVREWTEYFKAGGNTAAHIVLNPLDGVPQKTKTGDKNTPRGDFNVNKFRYSLVEFDDLSHEDQIRFWSAVKLPVVALVDSANKSIHGWLDVSRLAVVKTADEWITQIKNRLYDQMLRPLGVDVACSNAARLSRLPGHYRTEKDAYQRLLWLAPTGRPI